jgi:hypothetical protein
MSLHYITYCTIYIMTTTTPVFRFKFTSNFNTELISFSKIHQYDDKVTYKEYWERWIDSNYDLVHKEIMYLKENGYDGDIMKKMYRSGRYYYRNKSTSEQKPKKRRNYVSIDKEVIDIMDNTILQYSQDWYNNEGTKDHIIKPSALYKQFCLNNNDLIADETKRLSNMNLSTSDINDKLKKTYKNRYFLFKDKCGKYGILKCIQDNTYHITDK